MTKVHAKSAAILLRKAGHSYNYIATEVGVSKGTLAIWLADVPYIPNAETLLRIGKARAASGAAKSRIKLASIESARISALKEMGRLARRDIFMVGLGLYIGEGAKSTLQTVFVNSNPQIICFMVKWFTRALWVPTSNLRIRLHVYPDCDVNQSVAYWSRVSGMPVSQFQKTVVDWRKDKKAVKLGKLPHGTAHLSVRSMGEKKFGVFLARKILAWSNEAMK